MNDFLGLATLGYIPDLISTFPLLIFTTILWYTVKFLIWCVAVLSGGNLMSREKSEVGALITQGTKIGKLIGSQSSYWDSESRRMKLGEPALLMAVVSKAIEDLPLILSIKADKRMQGQKSISFIFSEGLDCYADSIGLSPDYIREKIKQWMSQWAGDARPIL